MAGLALPGAASSQMCPPPTVALVLRDASGEVSSALAFDSVTFGRGAPRAHEPIIHRDRVPRPPQIAGPGDSIAALVWQARICIVEFPSITVWRSGRRMVLLAPLWLQTVGGGGRPRTPDAIILELPAFRPGRWTLTPCATRPAGFSWVFVGRERWRPLRGRHPGSHAACPEGTVPVSLKDGTVAPPPELRP